jgi:hypothetical protein
VPYPPCTVTTFWLKYQDPARMLRRVTQPPHIAGPLAVTLKHFCMRKTILETLVFVSLLSSCGIISKSLDKPMDALAKIIIPDTCEIQLINYIGKYRKDSLRSPDTYEVLTIIKSQSQLFQEKFGSITSYPYGKDSMDLSLGIKESSYGDDFLSRRNYRILFNHDTIKKIIPSYPKEYTEDRNAKNNK